MQSSKQAEWNPFVGPRPFRRDSEEQNIFFGRNYETEKIISLIYSHQLVLVYAQSGAGKTSIFNASVVPLLEERGLQVLPVARVGVGSRTFDKSSSQNGINIHDENVNSYLLNAYQSLVPNVDTILLLKTKSFIDFLQKYFPRKVNQRGKSAPQVIIFDQLEELFTFYSDPDRWREHREDFFKQIVEALEKDPLLRVVFVAREDYLARFDPYTSLFPERLRPRFRLERLRKEAAFQAIIGPFEKAKAYADEKKIIKLFDEGVIDKLIDDLLKVRIETLDGQSHDIKGEFVEPIQLQVVCQRLWDRLKTSQTSRIKQDFVGDIDKALIDFYTEAIQEAAEETGLSEDRIRNWFEEELITTSGTRGIVHKGTNSTGGIPNRAVDILENRYIVRKEERSGAQWYELTHDRLIKPIKDSNSERKHQIEVKRAKKNLKLKIIIPIGIGVVIAAIFIAFAIQPPAHAIPCASVGSPTFVTVGGTPRGVAINPNTDMIYVTDYLHNSVSAIDCRTNEVVSNTTVGISPMDLAVNPTTNTIYVANMDSNTTSVIDGETNKVIEEVAVGIAPVGVALNPTTNTIYVANSASNTTSVIDGDKNEVLKNLTVGIAPVSVAVNPTTNTIYVANMDSNTTSVINGDKNEVLKNLTVGLGPTDLAVNPTTKAIYAANYYSDTVSVIDGDTDKVLKNVTVGLTPNGVAVNPITNTIYVANSGADSISVIDGESNEVMQPMKVGKGPFDIAVNQNLNMVYVTNSQEFIGTVHLINASNKDITNHIPVGDSPNGVAVNPNTNLIYVANAESYSTSVIDGDTDKVVDEVSVGGGAFAVAVNPSTNRIYVVNNESRLMSVIDGDTNEVLKNVPVGVNPLSVAVNPTTNTIYVANSASNTISVIDGDINEVLKNVTVGVNPFSVAVNPTTNTIYVANRDSDTVSVIDGDTDKVLKNVTVGLTPSSVAVNPTTNTIYVANCDSDTISVIDGFSNNEVWQTDAGICPLSLSIDLMNKGVYIIDSTDDITIMNEETFGTTELRDLLLGDIGSEVTIDSVNNRIYVSELNSNTVLALNTENVSSIVESGKGA